MGSTLLVWKAPDIVQKRYDCDLCAGRDPNPECIECEGKGEIVFHGKAVELSLTTGSVMLLMQILNVPGADEEYGKIERDRFPDVRRRIMELRARPELIDAVTHPTHITPAGSGGTRITEREDGITAIQRLGPTMISMGTSREKILRRLTIIEALMDEGVKYDDDVYWC